MSFQVKPCNDPVNSCSDDNTERNSHEYGYGRGSQTLGQISAKEALVTEIIQGTTTVAEASRAFDMPPSEIEERIDEAKRGMGNALRAKPLDVREQYERQIKEFRGASGIRLVT